MSTLRIAGPAGLVLLWATTGVAVSEPHSTATRHAAARPGALHETASETSPLGATAKVTNLENGRSVLVQIHDRGFRVDSRIMDVSPQVAERLGIKTAGEVPVVIALIASQPNGALGLEVGAVKVRSREAAAAARVAEAAPQ
jgi:rare lipoprotein A